ncbi:UNKNOWN [Stylonychia lemnae]|uniref:AMP-activated protein kinase glycogen-binding domain-containing protein n=1 Tax=Stylonychia lemnae TaxID=5949 RepID=A0A078AGK6_STYLE|nr:UNKNOWN [Stylonychia lemnae]|eukprot:CDW81359.1 UNKNOWN [Stylonychia lemnae]
MHGFHLSRKQQQSSVSSSQFKSQRTSRGQKFIALGTQKQDLSGPVAQKYKQQFSSILLKPQQQTFKYLIRQKFMAAYSYQMRMTIHLTSTSSDMDFSSETIAKQEKLKKLRRQLRQNTITFNQLRAREEPIMSARQALDTKAYMTEQDLGSVEIKRIKRDAEYQSWINLNQAAISIQKIYKGVTEKDYLLKFLEDKYHKDMTEPSLRLQAIYRQVRTQTNAKQEYLIQVLKDKITNSIIVMQSLIRLKQQRRKVKMAYLIKRIMRQRERSAVIIQKHYKRYAVQQLYSRVIEFERNYLSIKWSVQEPMPHNVQVIGSFTNPPWEKKVELDYCPLRRIFVKYMSNLSEGTHMIKFIVDSQFKCDPYFPVITDSTGHLNNILEIVSGTEQSERYFSRQQSISSSLKEGLQGSLKSYKRSQKSREGANQMHMGAFQNRVKRGSQGFNAYINQGRQMQFDKVSSKSSKEKLNIFKNDKNYHLEEFEEFKYPYEESKQSSYSKKDYHFNRMSPIPSVKRDFIDNLGDDLIDQDFDRISLDDPSQKASVLREEMKQQQRREEDKQRLKSKNKLLTYEDSYEEEQLDTKITGQFGLNQFGFGQSEYQASYNMPQMMEGIQYDDYYAQHYYQDENLVSTQLSFGNMISQNPDNFPLGGGFGQNFENNEQPLISNQYYNLMQFGSNNQEQQEEQETEQDTRKESSQQTQNSQKSSTQSKKTMF